MLGRLVGKTVTVVVANKAYIRGILKKKDSQYSVSFSGNEGGEVFTATAIFSEGDVLSEDHRFIYVK